MHKRFDLQFFAEPAGGENPDGAENQPDGDGGRQPGNQTRTYDQAEVDRIANERAQRAERAAITGWAQQQGMTPEEIKALLEDHKARKEAEKTDLQKAQDAIAAETAKTSAKEKEIAALNGKIIALSLGVQPEYLDDALALASLHADYAENTKAAIEAVLSRHPSFVAAAAAGSPKPDSAAGYAPGGGQKPFEDMDSKERMTLKEKNPTLYQQLRQAWLDKRK